MRRRSFRLQLPRLKLAPRRTVRPMYAKGEVARVSKDHFVALCRTSCTGSLVVCVRVPPAPSQSVRPTALAGLDLSLGMAVLPWPLGESIRNFLQCLVGHLPAKKGPSRRSDVSRPPVTRRATPPCSFCHVGPGVQLPASEVFAALVWCGCTPRCTPQPRSRVQNHRQSPTRGTQACGTVEPFGPFPRCHSPDLHATRCSTIREARS